VCVEEIWQLCRQDGFVNFGVVCDGSSMPQRFQPCFGACCVFQSYSIRRWYSLTSLDPLLSHNGLFTAPMAELLAVTLAVKCLKRAIGAHSMELYVVYTDRKELLGTLFAALAQSCPGSCQIKRISHRRSRRQTSPSFWVWSLILFAAVKQLLLASASVLRIQAAQSAGVVVHNHRWFLPDGWLDPHRSLGAPGDLLDVMSCSVIGDILCEVRQQISSLISAADGRCSKRRLVAGLCSEPVKVVAAAYSGSDIVSIDIQYRVSSAVVTSSGKA